MIYPSHTIYKNKPYKINQLNIGTIYAISDYQL